MAQLISVVPKAWLLLGKGGTGVVHSVFRQVVNITSGDDLFSIHETDFMTPMSIRIRCGCEFDPEKWFYRGQTAVFFPKGIQLGNELIESSSPQVWDPLLVPNAVLRGNRLWEIGDELTDLIAQNRDRGGFRDSVLPHKAEPAHSDPVVRLFVQQIAQVNALLQENKVEQAARSAAGLLGLGPGLTPSGDDFLCGLLAILTGEAASPEGARFKSCLADDLMKHLHKTTEISAAYLKHAVRSEFSEPIHRFFGARNGDERRRAAEEILDFGHSSGLDVLSGIYMGLAVLKGLNETR